MEELRLSVQACRDQVGVIDAMILADPANEELLGMKAQLYVRALELCDTHDRVHESVAVSWDGRVATIQYLDSEIQSLVESITHSMPEVEAAVAAPSDIKPEVTAERSSTWSVGDTCLVLTYPSRTWSSRQFSTISW
jgi:hypothetical protein